MIAAGTILLDKYRVEKVLGQGGMGVVVQATHLHLQQPVAIKMLLPALAERTDVVDRFVREARATVRLKGEHVARVTDVGVLPDGAPYMVMEFLEGHDLQTMLAQRGALPPGEAVDYVLQICEAMAEAHALGIVHRDLKPANCFATRRADGTALIKVLDFGISKVLHDQGTQLTAANAVVGTPQFMSPEQLCDSRSVDARADLWSLGVILYQALCGHLPFSGGEFGALVLAVTGQPPAPMGVALPARLASAVSRCLEKEPARRFQSVAELAAELAPFAATQSAAASHVERARGILRLASEPGMRALTPPSGTVATSPGASAPSPTTLGSSAGAMVSGRRPRGIWIGAAVLVAAGAVIAIVSIAGSRSTQESRPTATPAVTSGPEPAPALSPPPTSAPAPATAPTPAPTPAPAPAAAPAQPADPSASTVAATTSSPSTATTKRPTTHRATTTKSSATKHSRPPATAPSTGETLQLDENGMPIRR